MINVMPKVNQYISYKTSKNSIEVGKIKDVYGTEIITESINGSKRTFSNLFLNDVVLIKESDVENYIDYEI